MKISSKSILSPGRGGVRDPPASLSSSLSRRLKNSGSMKGGASPAMFPTATKKRGTFENPEPSSPKVTCIGQVRVRGKKKQAKKLRTLSRRHSSGEVTFRKQDHFPTGFCSNTQNIKQSLNLGSKGSQNYSQSQNQDFSPAVQRSWVHFPVTVCEALRAFGSEFSCLIPCRTGKEEKTVTVAGEGGQGSCGKLFTRWLVAVEDGGGGGEGDIELVVGDEDDESVVRKTRRHVFEDLEIINGRVEGHVDEGRVSICVPPKNALLLMRCRSDPVKTEALCNSFCEPIGGRNEEEEDDEFVDCESRVGKDLECEVTGEVMVLGQDQENVQQDEANQNQELNNEQKDDADKVQVFDDMQQDEADKVRVFDNMQQNEADKVQVFHNMQQDEADKVQVFDNMQQDEADKVQVFDDMQQDEVDKVQVFDNMQQDEADEVQVFDNVQQYEAVQDQEHNNVERYDVGQDQEFDNVQKDEVYQEQEHDSVQQYEVGQNQEQEHDSVQEYEAGREQEREQTEVEDESFNLVSLFEETVDQDYEIQENDETRKEDEFAETEAEDSTMVTEFVKFSETEAQEHNTGVLDRENEVKETRGGEEVLPECLLMMMHEPKLSINISKETWVCSTDFVKRKSNKRKPPPLPPPIKPGSGDGSSVGTAATVNDGFPAALPQPARSSCSLPMATVLEQKLASAVGYEPFVLTRCKSEPVKTAASKLLLVPESCVLENRKLEGMRRVTFGLGF